MRESGSVSRDLYGGKVLPWIIVMMVSLFVLSGLFQQALPTEYHEKVQEQDLETTALFYSESPRALEAYYESCKKARYRDWSFYD